MRTDSQNRPERVDFFRESEERHFDYCVQQGLMTAEERDAECAKLREVVKNSTAFLISKNPKYENRISLDRA